MSVGRSFLAAAPRGLRKKGWGLRRVLPSGAAACGLLCDPCVLACCALSHSQALCAPFALQGFHSHSKAYAACSVLAAVWSAAEETIFTGKGSFSLPCIGFPRKRGKTAEHLYCRAERPGSMHPTLKGGALLCANSRYASRLPGCRGSPLRSWRERPSRSRRIHP